MGLDTLPDGRDEVVFEPRQTYSDGTIVRWIEEPQDGPPEPKNPAPVPHLTATTSSNTDFTTEQAPTDIGAAWSRYAAGDHQR